MAGPRQRGYTPQEHAGWIEAWLDPLDLDRMVLVVQDWGGPIGFFGRGAATGGDRGVGDLEHVVLAAGLEPRVVFVRDRAAARATIAAGGPSRRECSPATSLCNPNGVSCSR